jgi:hypothetical protein
MTIDEIARAAGDRMRQRTGSDVDAHAGLDAFMRSLRRRRQIRIGAAAVSAAAVVVAVAITLHGQLTTARSDGPTHVGPSPVPSAASGDPCGLPFVACVDGRPARIAMRIPISLRLPQVFQATVGSFAIDDCCGRPNAVELLRSDVSESSRSGVTLLEDVQAAAADQRAGPDTSVPLDARSLARWLAGRSDLDSTGVSRGTTGGLPSWTVTVRVANPSSQPDGSCLTARVNCTPILYLGELVDDPLAGMWGDMVSRFTFVALPEHDAAVVWSWTFGDVSLLDGDEALIDSIHFDVPPES